MIDLFFALAMFFGFLGSAFFSGTETAFVSISLVKVHHRAARGERSMQLLEKILSDPSGYLSTILVGNNVMNVFVASVASWYFAQRFSYPLEQKLLLLLVLTPLLLVTGEIIPKTLARHNPMLFSHLVLPFYRASAALLRPAVGAVGRIQRLFLGESREELERKAEVSREEISHLVRMSEAKGAIEDDEAAMIGSVIELGATQVREIMVPRVNVAMVEERFTYNQIMEVFLEQGYSRLPVYRKTPDTVVGLVHFINILESDPANFKLAEIIHPILFVPESMAVDDLLTEFRRKRAYQAIVVDEYGGTAGMVTVEDAVEEIFGEIEDELDEIRWHLVEIGEGLYSVDGAMDLDELVEVLRIPFGRTEAESVGGYVVERLGALPKQGERLMVDGFEFIVSDASDRAVRRLVIRRLDENNADGEKK